MKNKEEYLAWAERIASRTKRTRVVKFYRGVDLRNGHDGLTLIAKEDGIDLKNLNSGEFVAFANASVTGLKIYAPGNLIVYAKHPEGRRIDLRVIQFIPQFFSGAGFNFDGALKEVLQVKGLKAA